MKRGTIMQKDPLVRAKYENSERTIERIQESDGFECDVCGEFYKNAQDVRIVGEHIICVDCLRDISFSELCELCGVSGCDDVYGLLDMRRPVYSYYEDDRFE